MTEVHITKRRAIAARLLAFLLPVLILGVQVASADATPLAPRLLSTDPPSSEVATANFTLPSILGEAEPEDGVILKSFPVGVSSHSALTTSAVKNPTAHPNYEIQIFASSECLLGTEVAHGTAAALEGVGIPVPVPADSATTFSAIQVDPANRSEPSGCSNSLTYWEGNVPAQVGGEGGGGGGALGTERAGNGESEGEGGSQVSGEVSSGGSSAGNSSSGKNPSGKSSGGSVGGANPAGPKPAAPNLHMLPGERANDLTPSVVGSAPGASAVTVYSSSNCSGSPVAKGSPAELAAGFAVTVAKNATATFSAVSIGAQHSGCSDPVTYTEDSTAPRTRFTMGPGIKTRKRKAIFRFKDITEDPPGTTFRCKVDKAKWKPCASPFHLKHLKLGHHTVSVRATDTAGNVERKPAKRRFIVVPPA
jgi:hypothetical protein